MVRPNLDRWEALHPGPAARGPVELARFRRASEWLALDSWLLGLVLSAERSGTTKAASRGVGVLGVVFWQKQTGS